MRVVTTTTARRAIADSSPHRTTFIQSVADGASVIDATPRLLRAHSKLTPTSSVLVPIVKFSSSSPAAGTAPGASGLSIILTKRSALLKAHRGEVCFPGGKIDVGETLEECALRETAEETGLPANGIAIWSALNAVLTSRQGHNEAPLFRRPPRDENKAVVPFVGALRDPTELQEMKPNFEEVDSIFSVRVEHLMESVATTSFAHPKFSYCLPVFRVRDFTVHAQSERAFIPREYRIWGLSAIILHQALCHLEPERYRAFKVTFS